MLKRICAVYLILVLTATLIAVLPVSAASDSEIQLVVDLGIIDVPDNTGLIPKGFTRADFARSLCIMERNDNPPFVSGEEAVAYASDIADDGNCNFIVSVLSAGYMKTDGNGSFNPQKSVSLNDAVVALVKMLGYEPMANANGGNYEAYYKIALKIGLMKGVSVENKDKLTAREVAEMITNTMGAPLFLPDNIDYGEDCLGDRWNISENTGKILANSNMGLFVDKVDSSHINIDGKIYYTKLLITNELVGSNVTYYTIYGDMGDEVVSLSVKSYADSITLEAHEIKSVSDNGKTLIIKTDGKRSLKVDKNGFLMLGGKTIIPKKELFENFDSGTITFVDTNGNGTYDVIHMLYLFQTLVEGVNAEQKTMATLYDNLIISLENLDSYEIYLNDKAVTIADLKPKMAVGIACDAVNISTDGKIAYDFTKAENIKIYASNRVETGIVDSMDDDGIYVNEVKSRLGSGYKRFVNNQKLSKIRLGDFVDLYYDNLGSITYYEPNADGNTMEYGYLIASAVNRKSIEVKIMNSAGEIKIYETGQKFVLDGKKVSAESVTYSVNDTDDVDLNKRQVIKYRVVGEVLKEIDTSVMRNGVEDKINSLNSEIDFDPYTQGATKKSISGSSYMRQFLLTQDTVIFVDEAPMEETYPDDGLFSVMPASQMTRGDFYLGGYDANDMKELLCAVRYDGYGETNDSITKTSPLGYNVLQHVVEKIRFSVNENDEEGWTISVGGNLTSGKYFVPKDTVKLYEVSEDGWGKDDISVTKVDEEELTHFISEGDVIRFETDASGKNIKYIEKIFDFDPAMALQPAAFGSHNPGYIKIEKVSGRSVLYTEEETADATTYIFQERVQMTLVPLYHVEEERVTMEKIENIPSAASGNNVKAFVRFYDKTRCWDQVFYIFD